MWQWQLWFSVFFVRSTPGTTAEILRDIIFGHRLAGKTFRGFVSIPGGFNAIDDQETAAVNLSDIHRRKERESVEYDE